MQEKLNNQPGLIKKLLKSHVNEKPVYIKHKGKFYKIKQLG